MARSYSSLTTVPMMSSDYSLNLGAATSVASYAMNDAREIVEYAQESAESDAEEGVRAVSAIGRWRRMKLVKNLYAEAGSFSSQWPHGEGSRQR